MLSLPTLQQKQEVPEHSSFGQIVIVKANILAAKYEGKL
jgi:hypothetical protein